MVRRSNKSEQDPEIEMEQYEQDPEIEMEPEDPGIGEIEYEGSGCEDFCGEMDADEKCFIPPCMKCPKCGAEVAASAKFMQVGKIKVGGWSRPRVVKPQDFKFAEAFQTVPIVVITANTRGPHPAVIRVKDVTTTGFTAVITEPVGEDGPHADMDVAYVAVVPGIHTLPDGRTVVAGSLDTVKDVMSWRCKDGGAPQEWETLKFEKPFDKPPAIVSTIQTMANEVNQVPKKPSMPFLTVAMKELNAGSVKVSLERAEGGKFGGVTTPEKIGYIAFEAGTGSFPIDRGITTVKYATILSNDAIPGWGNRAHKAETANVPFGTDLGNNEPLVVSGQVSRDGGDGGWARIQSANAKAAKITIDEDRKCDRERAHTSERVAIFAFSTVFAA
eukprot:TRINITY_DN5680_c0_g1_i1.p2 TRINITY_DN5680_c0_g1~~TRINITY_DN5680_c0_g1_i1.p2  ORF type:complete len:387 (-),score=65.37 TRINITY_DN5680_c0_g1_i1:80-1240(-)